MIGHLIDHARLRVETAATHYGGRALVVLPVAIAAGFAIAAVYLLIETQTGPIAACAIMAALFVVIAIGLAMVLLARERTQRMMLRQSAQQSAMMASMFAAAPAVLAGGRRAVRRLGVAPLLLGSVALAALVANRNRAPDLHRDL